MTVGIVNPVGPVGGRPTEPNGTAAGNGVGTHVACSVAGAGVTLVFLLVLGVETLLSLTAGVAYLSTTVLVWLVLFWWVVWWLVVELLVGRVRRGAPDGVE